MIRRAIGKLWKILPRTVRLGIVRSTQVTFTVSVTCIVINNKSEVLMLDHVLRPRSGWGFPGGFLDANERTADAIRREIREETGIGLTDLRLERVLVHRRHVEIIYSARPIGEPGVQTSEIYRLGWFGFDSLPDGTTTAQKMLIGEVLHRQFDKEAVDN
jgi:8-oxo-dGTP pyrophosphatase MutT (NUDIX family)